MIRLDHFDYIFLLINIHLSNFHVKQQLIKSFYYLILKEFLILTNF